MHKLRNEYAAAKIHQTAHPFLGLTSRVRIRFPKLAQLRRLLCLLTACLLLNGCDTKNDENSEHVARSGSAATPEMSEMHHAGDVETVANDASQTPATQATSFNEMRSPANISQAKGLQVSLPSMREAIPGQTMTAGYMTLRNVSAQDLELIEVRAEFSPDISMHTLAMDGETMRMRSVSAVTIPAGGEVKFKSGGLHLMVALDGELPNPAPVTLHLRDADGTAFTLPVSFGIQKLVPRSSGDR